MDQPEPTSPEVADACRRAGLPIVPDRNEANVAMSAGVADRTMPAGDVERGLHELQVVLRKMDALFGPALTAPALQAHDELQGAYDRYRWEVEDIARHRRMLVDRCAGLERRVDELVGERDRARAAAVALEQELAPAPARDVVEHSECSCQDPDRPNVVHVPVGDGPCYVRNVPAGTAGCSQGCSS